jgi:hypothetical protein
VQRQCLQLENVDLCLNFLSPVNFSLFIYPRKALSRVVTRVRFGGTVSRWTAACARRCPRLALCVLNSEQSARRSILVIVAMPAD